MRRERDGSSRKFWNSRRNLNFDRTCDRNHRFGGEKTKHYPHSDGPSNSSLMKARFILSRMLLVHRANEGSPRSDSRVRWRSASESRFWCTGFRLETTRTGTVADCRRCRQAQRRKAGRPERQIRIRLGQHLEGPRRISYRCQSCRHALKARVMLWKICAGVQPAAWRDRPPSELVNKSDLRNPTITNVCAAGCFAQDLVSTGQTECWRLNRSS